MTEEKENQDFQGEEKIYPNPGVKPLTYIMVFLANGVGIGLGVLIRIYAVEIAVAIWDVALKNVVNTFRACGLGIAIIFTLSLVAYFILSLGGFLVEEIAFTKAGVVFKRRRNSIVMQRIANVKEGKRGRVLKLTGLTPEGKSVNRKVSQPDVGKKRWQEFKQDIQKIQSSD
jgi:hypothetical protein